MNNEASGENSAAHHHKQSHCSSKGGKKRQETISLIHKISWVTLTASALCTVSRTKALILWIAIICPLHVNTPLVRTVGCNYMGRVAALNKCPATMFILQNNDASRVQRPQGEPSLKSHSQSRSLPAVILLGSVSFQNRPQRRFGPTGAGVPEGACARRKYLCVKMWLWGNAWDW